MLNFVKKFDLFGQNVTLNLNSKQYYTTFLGGIATCTFVIVMGIFLAFQTKDFVNKKEIRVQSQTFYDNDPPVLTLNKDNFMFATSIEQPSEYPFNQSPFFNIEVRNNQYHKINGESERKKTILQMVPCTLEHWTNLADESKDYDSWVADYEKNDFKTWLCPQLDYSFDLQGVFNSDFFDFISFTVYPCDNTDETKKIDGNWQPVCASEETVHEYLLDDGSFRLQIYTSNYVVNPQQKQNHQTYLSSDLQFTFIPGEMFRKADIYYQDVILETDNNIGPTESITSKRFPVNDVASMREQFELNKPNDQYAKIFFRRSKFTLQHSISYQKLFDLVSYIEGFTEIILSGVAVIMCYYNRQEQLINLANKLYDFDLDPPSKKPKPKPLKKINKILTSSKIAGSLQKSQQGSQKIDITQSETKTIQNSKRQKGGAEIRELINSRFLDYKDVATPSRSKALKNQHPVLKNSVKFNNSILINKNPSTFTAYNSMMNMSTIQQDVILDDKELEEKVKNTEKMCKDLGFKSKRQFLTFQFQELVKKSKLISLGIGYFIYKVTGGCLFKNKRNKVIDKSIVLVKDQMDVTRVIKKMVEVEKLKHLLLNQDQLVLFNYFPKPVIKPDDIKQINTHVALEQEISKIVSKSKKDIQNKKKKTQAQIRASLRLNLNTYMMVIKAKKKFLSLLKSKKLKIEPTTLDDYKRLYNAYENLMYQTQDFNNIDNEQLISLVGKEMKEIFQTSNLIKFDKLYLDEIKKLKKKSSNFSNIDNFRTFKEYEFNNQIQKAEQTIKTQQLGFLHENQETQGYPKFIEKSQMIEVKEEELEPKDKKQVKMEKSSNRSSDTQNGKDYLDSAKIIQKTQEANLQLNTYQNNPTETQQMNNKDQSNNDLLSNSIFGLTSDHAIPDEEKLCNSSFQDQSLHINQCQANQEIMENYNNMNLSFRMQGDVKISIDK